MEKNRITCSYCKENVCKSSYYSRHRNGKCVVPRKRTLLTSEAESCTVEVVENITGNCDPRERVDCDNSDITDFAVNQNPEVIESEVDMRDDHDQDDVYSDVGNENEDQLEEEVWTAEENPVADFVEVSVEKSGQNVLVKILRLIFIWQTLSFISDSALESLLSVIEKMIRVLNEVLRSEVLENLLDDFPASLYKARKLVGVNRDTFQKFVVCKKCDSIYTYEEALERKDGKLMSKLCSKVEFPDHSQARFRQPCGTALMKSCKSMDGKRRFLYPYKVYSTQKIQICIELMLKRRGFKETLLKGPVGTSEIGLLSDVCDGQMYKSFLDNEGNLFFNDKRNIGTMLNVDWFNPFKRTEYSMGVIYLVLLNLPRNIRFKWENVITLGIIPGPKEPTLTINSFLHPIVNELIELWEGKVFDENGTQAVYKVALIATSSDIPATRKCGGFMAHNANKGCSKCLVTFPRDENNKPDYSGYDDESWLPRQGSHHKKLGNQWLSATNKVSREALEYDHGVRFSELFRLEYFNPVRMHLIDPMHNLMLGVAKNTFRTWIERGVLTDEKLYAVECRMEKLKLASDTGRIAKNVSKCYKSMKADEWKHFTLIYSMFALRTILDQRDLNMWNLFVNACKLICQRGITVEMINEAHQMLKMFCVLFCESYGKEYCVPNMHLALHLKDCVLDYGSVYGFWCFSFERFNGTLGKYHINNHSLTIQVMRKFLTGIQLSLFNDDEDEDGIDDAMYKSCIQLANLNDRDQITGTDLEFTCSKPIAIPNQVVLSTHAINYIRELFQKYYDIPIRILSFAKTYSRIEFLNQILSTDKYRGGNSPYSKIMARFSENNETDIGRMLVYPAIIKDIFEVVIVKDIQPTKKTMIILNCQWFKESEYKDFFGYRSTNELWSTEFLRCSYIPIQFVVGRCVICREKVFVKSIGNLNCYDNFNVVIPLPSKSIL